VSPRGEGRRIESTFHHGTLRAAKHDLGASELRAEGRTVTATADGRTFGVLSLRKGGQCASGHPLRSGSGREAKRL
jgi:hypothetical protein